MAAGALCCAANPNLDLSHTLGCAVGDGFPVPYDIVLNGTRNENLKFIHVDGWYLFCGNSVNSRLDKGGKNG